MSTFRYKELAEHVLYELPEDKFKTSLVLELSEEIQRVCEDFKADVVEVERDHEEERDAAWHRANPDR